MKKHLLLAAAFISLSCMAGAQITKGSVLLGGSVAVSTGESKYETYTSKATNYTIGPSMGFAVKENLVLGLGLSYGHGTTESTNSSKGEGNSYSAGIFARKYLPLGKSFYLFGQGGLNYAQSTSKSSPASGSNREVEKSIGLDFYPGITYAVNKRFHLEASLNNLLYVYYHTSEDTYTDAQNGTVVKTEGNGFGLGTNLTSAVPLSVGFRFMLSK